MTLTKETLTALKAIALKANDLEKGAFDQNNMNLQIFLNIFNPTQVLELLDAIESLKEGLEYNAHACMNDDFCPSRVDMRAKSRQTLTKVFGDDAKGE